MSNLKIPTYVITRLLFTAASLVILCSVTSAWATNFLIACGLVCGHASFQ